MREWALMTEEPGSRALNFEDFPFQEEWYSDEVARAREVVLKKSTQVGASAFTWRLGMRDAEQLGRVVLYIFPTDDDVYDFGDNRIDPAVDESPPLRARKGRVWQKRLKQVGNGWLYLRGSRSRSGAQSVPAATIIFDEYDHLDAANVPQIERRISGAAARGEPPRVVRLGNPTLPGYGIDEAYGASDQRIWMVTCPDCGHEQELTWEANVRWSMPDSDEVYRAGHDQAELANKKVVGDAWRACAECEQSLEGEPVRRGRWVAQNPGAPVVGFHASRLIVPRTDLRAIVIASRGTKPAELEAFHNNDLGLAYSPSEASLDRATIIAACLDGGAPQQGYRGRYPITMGVDVKSRHALSARVSEQLPDGRRRALAIFEPASFEDVWRAMRAFRVWMCVIDGQPEHQQALALRRDFLGRVVLCEYDHRFRSKPLELKELDPRNIPVMVRVNRTLAVDAMMDGVRNGVNVPLAEPSEKYLAQMEAMKRRTVEDTKGEPERMYVTTGTQGDDYAHAEVYDLIATELLRMRQGLAGTAEEVRGSPMPDAVQGFRRVRLSSEDDAAATDYRAGFED